MSGSSVAVPSGTSRGNACTAVPIEGPLWCGQAKPCRPTQEPG